jgi:hypothetical protein
LASFAKLTEKSMAGLVDEGELNVVAVVAVMTALLEYCGERLL